MARLLLLPGVLCDARLWRDVLARLECAPAPAFADLTRDDSVGAMAERVLAETDGRLALAGLSLGGYVALEIARRAPERLAGLCLLDTSARADTPEQARRRRLAIALRESGQFAAVSRQLPAMLLHPDSRADAALRDELLAMAARTDRAAYLRQQRAILARPDQRGWLGALRVPTLVLAGGADRVTPPELGREIAALIPAARFVEIAGAGHLPPMEQPAPVAAAMRAWLGEIA
jgi:pimeloyl-ACP methyl ester carboxylesterase